MSHEDKLQLAIEASSWLTGYAAVSLNSVFDFLRCKRFQNVDESISYFKASGEILQKCVWAR